MTRKGKPRSASVVTEREKAPIVGIIMGSRSDWETMSGARETLDELEIPCEIRVVSAHRMPDEMFEYAASAAHRGLKAIIAGAGGAAHLPGMTAAKTLIPVIGVPVQSARVLGLDSLLSIVQMPPGVPVASMAIGGAVNAALFAARIVALQDAGVAARLTAYVARMHDAAASSVLD
jgi:5-(carboxyamino)imidazole ribonucleotide mutase